MGKLRDFAYRQENMGGRVLIFLTVLVSLVIGASFFLIDSTIAPIYVGVIAALIPIVLFWIRKPSYALYVFIFISLLPYGLIPPQIYDYLYKCLAVVIPIIWLFDTIRNQRRIILNITFLVMISFLIWSLITLIWTSNTKIGEFFLQIYLIRIIVFLLLVPNIIRTTKDIEGMMSTLALSGWTLVLASVFTLITVGYSQGIRFKVFDENENGLGTLALITMIGVVWKGLQPVKPNHLILKALAYLYILFTTAIIGISGSRGSAISLLVTLLAFWLWKPTRNLGRVSIISLIVIGLIVPFLFQPVIERFLIADQTSSLLGGREAFWSAAWTYIKDKPWFGVGIGNSNYVILSYLQNFRSAIGLEYASVHNPILSIWMETGILGILLYLGGLISAIFLFIQQYKNINRNYRVQLNLYFAVVASVFLGYMFSWIKAGGTEASDKYFLMLALLILPSSFVLINPMVNENINGDTGL